MLFAMQMYLQCLQMHGQRLKRQRVPLFGSVATERLVLARKIKHWLRPLLNLPQFSAKEARARPHLAVARDLCHGAVGAVENKLAERRETGRIWDCHWGIACCSRLGRSGSGPQPRRRSNLLCAVVLVAEVVNVSQQQVRPCVSGHHGRVNVVPLALECHREAHFLHRLGRRLGQHPFRFAVRVVEAGFDSGTVDGAARRPCCCGTCSRCRRHTLTCRRLHCWRRAGTGGALGARRRGCRVARARHLGIRPAVDKIVLQRRLAARLEIRWRSLAVLGISPALSM